MDNQVLPDDTVTTPPPLDDTVSHLTMMAGHSPPQLHMDDLTFSLPMDDLGPSLSIDDLAMSSLLPGLGDNLSCLPPGPDSMLLPASLTSPQESSPPLAEYSEPPPPPTPPLPLQTIASVIHREPPPLPEQTNASSLHTEVPPLPMPEEPVTFPLNTEPPTLPEEPVAYPHHEDELPTPPPPEQSGASPLHTDAPPLPEEPVNSQENTEPPPPPPEEPVASPFHTQSEQTVPSTPPHLEKMVPEEPALAEDAESAQLLLPQESVPAPPPLPQESEPSPPPLPTTASPTPPTPPTPPVPQQTSHQGSHEMDDIDSDIPNTFHYENNITLRVGEKASVSCPFSGTNDTGGAENIPDVTMTETAMLTSIECDDSDPQMDVSHNQGNIESGQRKRKLSGQEQSMPDKKSKYLESENQNKTVLQNSENNASSTVATGFDTMQSPQTLKAETPNGPVALNHKQEFEIIDDLGSEDDEEFEFDSDLDEDEIDALLEEGMQNYRGQEGGSNDEEDFAAPIEREKIVLKEHNLDPFDILPEGWVAVTHNSGMPVYLHKPSRVCSLSRPYFLGPGSARKHDIPLSAVPCLQYQKEVERSREEVSKAADEPVTNGISESAPDAGKAKNTSDPQKTTEGADQNSSGQEKGPSVRVECLEKYNRDKMLGPLQLRDYCQRLFEFETITVKKYKTWKDRRTHHKLRKLNTRPSLPSNTKLITCPILINKQEDKPNKKKEFVLNPAGKSHICILHEYVQHALRVQPRYIIKELENAQTPYSATVIINQVEYGVGYASSKKSAKNEAAKVTLGILIPELKSVTETSQDIHDLSFFDEVKIEDPRVHDLCHKAGQPGPFQILCECLRRNFGMGDTHCQMDMRSLKHQKSEFTMRVGKHSATVICKNKRDGKQLAAQAILQKLHPHIHNWGSLLRLYGTDWKAIKEKKEELSVTSLHGQSAQHLPNTVILNKLKEEMKKLQMRRVSHAAMALDLATKWTPLVDLPVDLLRYLKHPLFGDLSGTRYAALLMEYLRNQEQTSEKSSFSWQRSDHCLCCAHPRRLVTKEDKSMQTSDEKTSVASQLPVKLITTGMQTLNSEVECISVQTISPVMVSVAVETEDEPEPAAYLVDPAVTAFVPRVLHKSKHAISNEDYIGKVFVEISTQTTETPEYPDSIGFKEKVPVTSAGESQAAYTQAIAVVPSLMSSITPGMFAMQPVIYQSQTAAVAQIAMEYSVPKNPAETPAPTETGQTTGNPQVDSSESSNRAYWRATPKNYTPHDTLVAAGTVPVEQRCWKAPSSAVEALMRKEGSKPGPSSPPRPKSVGYRSKSPAMKIPTEVQPLLPSENYQNHYGVQAGPSNGSVNDKQWPHMAPLMPTGEVALRPPGEEPVILDPTMRTADAQKRMPVQQPQALPPQVAHYRQPLAGVPTTNYVVPTYQAMPAAADPSAYYSQQYVYGQANAPFGYAYQTWYQ